MLLKNILELQSRNLKIAFKHDSNEISYKQLYNKCNKIYCKIKKIPLGNNIGIFLPNSIQYIVSYFIITMMDKTIVPINIQIKQQDLLNLIYHCELKTIITNTENLEIFKSSINRGIKINIFNLDTEEFLILNSDVSFVKITEEINGDNENCVAILLRTSGTMSNQKWVMLSHKNIIMNAKANINELEMKSNEISYICLPMQFSYCNTAQLISYMLIGATLIIGEIPFTAKSFFKSVHKNKITSLVCVPTILFIITNYKYKNNYNLESLSKIIIGGSRLSHDLADILMNKFSECIIYHTYGQTEASPRITTLNITKNRHKLGSVGKALENIEVRIVDENENDLSAFHVGELIIKGPSVMKGYYKNKDETDNVIKHGFLFTGDLGYFDCEKYIYIVGRKKNTINTGGNNIYPEEIEEVIIKHFAVRDVSVYKEIHDILGEMPIAKIVLHKYCYTSERNIIRFCKKHLPEYKVPHKIYFVKELKKTLSGKTIRIRN